MNRQVSIADYKCVVSDDPLDIEDGPFLHIDDKMTHKWAWPRSSDLIFKFWDPLKTFERITVSALILVQRWRTDPPCVRTIKRPLNERGRGHVTQLRNLGPPNNFGTNRTIHFKFGIQMKDGPFLRTEHKLCRMSGRWLVFAWHLQNSRRKSQEY